MSDHLRLDPKFSRDVMLNGRMVSMRVLTRRMQGRVEEVVKEVYAVGSLEPVHMAKFHDLIAEVLIDVPIEEIRTLTMRQVVDLFNHAWLNSPGSFPGR